MVKFIILGLLYLLLRIFEVGYSVLVDRIIQLSSMVNFSILEACYAKPYSTNVVDNGVLHNLVNCGNFWMCGLKAMKNRRVSAAAINGSLNGRCFNVRFGAL